MCLANLAPFPFVCIPGKFPFNRRNFHLSFWNTIIYFSLPTVSPLNFYIVVN